MSRNSKVGPHSTAHVWDRPRGGVITCFALVPGGSHGAWCYEFLAAELEDRGFKSRAIDLPSSDTSAGLTDYAHAVARALADVKDDVVLVGHSLAGSFLPLVESIRPVSGLVFLCAAIPVEGRSGRDLAAQGDMVAFPRDELFSVDEEGRACASPEVARRCYYLDCSDELANWAISQLVYQAPRPLDEAFPVGGWGNAPAASIVCTEDGCILPEWSRKAWRERTGESPVEIPGGHSPFLSRPGHLADVLVGLLPFAGGIQDSPESG